MNLLVVYQHYYPEPFRINDLCETLVRRGHQVTVLTGLPNYPEGRIYEGFKNFGKRVECINGVKVIRCPLIPRGKSKVMLFFNYVSFAFSASLTALRLKGEFDVIFAEQTSPVMMVIPAICYKKKHKKKLLLYCLDPWPDSLAAGGVKENSPIHKIFWVISKWIYRSADKLMVSSFNFIDYFKETFGFEESSVEYLPQYAEEIFIESEDIKIEEDKDCFNFVFAGNVGKAQSVKTIILAANELKDDRNIIFHIVGSGSALEGCRQMATELELENIIFHGRRPVEEMPYFYNLADAMLVTLAKSKSFSLTLPGKVQSYMAAGKAIIGAADGETNRVIKESGSGLCCGAEDHLALKAIILKFCGMNKRNQMPGNARAYYEKYFSKEHFMVMLEKALTLLGEQDDV